jgi:DNA-binding MarR family transcriptional regulator
MNATPSATPARPRRSGLDVLQQLRVVVRLADAHASMLEQATGVPGAQLWALHEIAEEEGLRVGELAHRMRMHQTTISNLVHKLERQGLVHKDRAGDDQRVVQLRTSAAGRKILRRAPTPRRGLLPHVLDSLTPEQLRKVHDGLAVLVERMGGFDAELAEKPMPFNE